MTTKRNEFLRRMARVYHRHYERMGNVEPTRDFVLREPWLPANRDAVILDVGCGWGHYLLGLWNAGYRNLTGIDRSEEGCRIARESLAGEIEIVCCDMFEYLEEQRDRFRLILLFDVIEHVTPEDVLRLLDLCHQALARGGSVVIRTPNMGNIFSAWSRYLDATHLGGYTEFSLFQLLDAARFVEHRLYSPNVRRWKLNSRATWNVILHDVLFSMRKQFPRPSTYAVNLVVESRKR